MGALRSERADEQPVVDRDKGVFDFSLLFRVAATTFFATTPLGRRIDSLDSPVVVTTFNSFD